MRDVGLGLPSPITRPRRRGAITDAPARVDRGLSDVAGAERPDPHVRRSSLRGRERATATAGGIVTRMRRDAIFIGGSVERL